MAIKKSELYSSLWASCDELRGGMDASQYKDYVLVLLFIKYFSDKYQGQPYAPITVPKGASFADMVALKGKPTIGDDILGDAYEFLMRHFATESSKSKGQVYTPAEVSRVMAKVIGIGSRKNTAETTAYDPTGGSGSLLLKVSDECENKISLFLQEKDVATAALAKMNLILHDNATAEIKKGQSTLSDPLFLEKTAVCRRSTMLLPIPHSPIKHGLPGLRCKKYCFQRQPPNKLPSPPSSPPWTPNSPPSSSSTQNSASSSRG